MAYQLYLIIRLKSYIPQIQLFCPLVRFATVITPLSFFQQLKYNPFNQSALALFEEKVLYVIKPSPIKQECLSTSWVDYLHINAFSDLMVVQQKGLYLKLYKQKLLEEPRISGEKTVGWTLWNLTFGTSTSAST